MNTQNDKKGEPLTKGRFWIKELRANVWPISWMIAMMVVCLMHANASEKDNDLYPVLLIGIALGLCAAFKLAGDRKFSFLKEGKEHLDSMRKIFDDMRSLGKQAQWLQQHAVGKVEWNFDEQRAEISGSTDDGNLHVLFYVEVVSDDTAFEDEILGARCAEKCPVIIYRVPTQKKLRGDRTKWVRVGSGATMLQGTNEANRLLNDAMRDVYNLQGEAADSKNA